jgi:hypothetical protein
MIRDRQFLGKGLWNSASWHRLCQLLTDLRVHVVQKEYYPMLKFYIRATEALKRLRADANGVVSFEYVIVAAAVVGAVVLAFGAAGGAGPISSALKSGIDAITVKITG